MHGVTPRTDRAVALRVFHRVKTSILHRTAVSFVLGLACDERSPSTAAEPSTTATAPVVSAALVEAAVPTSPPPQPIVVAPDEEIIAELVPETVVALQSSEAAAQWRQLDAGLYERIGGDPLRVAFEVHAFELEGRPHHFAMWGFDDGSAAYHGALFEGVEGHFRPVWVQRSFIVEPDPPDEPHLPWILELGREHAIIVFVPDTIGCGGEDCRHYVVFVDTVFLEITTHGVVEQFEVHGPGCWPAVGRRHVARNDCRVRTEPDAKNDGVPDLVVESFGRTKRTRRFTYRHDRLVEVQRPR